MTLKAVSLDDKFTTTKGRVFISGNQALVRLPMIQQQLDHQAGLDTAGFISGYRGSPLGNYDAALWQAKARLADHNIVFQPGVNEDLAATAVWGTQQLDGLPQAKVDGVFAIWYGKGPGVDRSGDPIKHANMSGTHRNGGVLLIYGDDHPGKSSTVAHQSEQALAANSVPSLYPASVEDMLEFGLLGWAMSRYTGLWVGMKTVNETMEQTATVDLDLDSFQPELPNRGVFPEQGVHHRPGQFTPLLDESLVTRYKLPLVHEFVRTNRINKVTLDSAERKLGIIAAGKAYQDVQEALALLDIDRERAELLGVSVFKVGCIWPLEPEGIKAFAQGQQELLFVEEKKPFLEDQAAIILYGQPQRPAIAGKFAQDGEALQPSDVQLEPVDIALLIAARLKKIGVGDAGLEMKVQQVRGRCDAVVDAEPSSLARIPYFCSGCPHNCSTKVPEGSYSSAGIGCHGMAVYIRPETMIFAQMGGEGATWYGLSLFTETKHIFQNLGDGTYYHSGLLAIRGAVATGVNITYKILFNDVVAMTGGQPVDGPLSVADITYQVLHEGVKRCVVVSDNPDSYGPASNLAKGVDVFHRDDLETVQKQLRDTQGCTVLIYEQTCATEKRRRRKRGLLADPKKRAFINDAVCEGCGDCSVQANCVSIQPKETALGRKRQIDQSSCNKDFSCVKGFCPSFVSVVGGELKKPQRAALDSHLFDSIPPAVPAPISDRNYNIMVSGIGGSGVITVSSVLGMAAHIENKACSIYDMTGLSQKNGAVYSHMRIAQETSGILAPRIGVGQADLALGFDLVAALDKDASLSMSQQQTRFIGNSCVSPTAMFQQKPDVLPDSVQLIQKATAAVENAYFVDATNIGLALLGDTIAANMFMVGYAAQQGLLPVSVAAIEEAIQLNGVAVAFNLEALSLGRLWAWKPELLQAKIDDHNPEQPVTDEEDLVAITEQRIKLLTSYQNRQYATRYETLLSKVHEAEERLEISAGHKPLSIAVAHNFAKLMAYKDEYEVARLYAEPAFMEKIHARFDGGFKLKLHLAPPLISRKDPLTGEVRKREFGGWVMGLFKVLAKMKRLRSTPLDIFGYTAERKSERKLIDDYEQMVLSLLPNLSASNYDFAVQLAELADQIRGYGHVKEKNIMTVRQQQEVLLNRYRNHQASEYIELRQVS